MLDSTGSFDKILNNLSKVSVYDLYYLNQINIEMENCTLIGDKAYQSKEVQPDLFTPPNIVLEMSMDTPRISGEPHFTVFKKVRKRIKSVFSQLDGQFNLICNDTKDTEGLFIRNLAKSARTVLQYINKFIINQPIGRVKHTLAA